MPGMFVDDDARHHGFGRDAVFDQVLWRGRLKPTAHSQPRQPYLGR
jgi:hypothetical protein